MNLISYEILTQRVSYDPQTGDFIWRATGNPRFDTLHAGKPAGSIKRSGYRELAITIDGRQYYIGCARAAWLYHYGHFPDGEVDHVNGARSDNRIANLRLATKSENARNRHWLASTKSSQFKGVTYDKATRKWQVSIRQKYIGQFDDEIDAALIYDALAKRHFGQFAKTNADLGLL